MKGTQILKQIGDCEKIINLLEEELISFENSYKKTQSKRVKSKILKIKCRIDREITNQAILKIKGYELIRKISNPKEKYVLIYHFICQLTLEETAYRLGYSTRHTMRLYKNACKSIDAQYDASTHNI